MWNRLKSVNDTNTTGGNGDGNSPSRELLAEPWYFVIASRPVGMRAAGHWHSLV